MKNIRYKIEKKCRISIHNEVHRYTQSTLNMTMIFKVRYTILTDTIIEEGLAPSTYFDILGYMKNDKNTI